MISKRLYRIAIFLISILNSSQVFAEEFIEPRESLGLIRNVYLHIDDQVSDKCWTNVSQIKQKARLTLEQSGISVYEEPLFIIQPFSMNLVITGLGLRAGDGSCFGNIEVKAFKEVFTDFGEEVLIKYIGVNFQQNSIAMSGNNLNKSFLNSVDTYISKFSSDVISNRRHATVKKILGDRTPCNPPQKQGHSKLEIFRDN